MMMMWRQGPPHKVRVFVSRPVIPFVREQREREHITVTQQKFIMTTTSMCLSKILLLLSSCSIVSAGRLGAQPVTVPDIELRSGVPVTGIQQTGGKTSYWTMHMPVDAGSVSCNISGGTGDADLYTRWDAEVDLTNIFANTVSRNPCVCY